MELTISSCVGNTAVLSFGSSAALLQFTSQLPGARVSRRQFIVSTEDSVNSPLGLKTLLTCTDSFRRINLANRAVAQWLFIDSVKRRQESLSAFLTAFLKIHWACSKASHSFPSFDLMALRWALRASLWRQVSSVSTKYCQFYDGSYAEGKIHCKI